MFLYKFCSGLVPLRNRTVQKPLANEDVCNHTFVTGGCILDC